MIATTPFTYVVLRYVHDNAVGECLNVGVLVSAVEENWVGLRVERNHGRLSAAFRDFPVELHREAMGALTRRVKNANPTFMGQGVLFPNGNAGRVIRTLWPDAGLNYQASEVKAGSASDLTQALDALFNRFVTSQTPNRRPRQRRDDSDVWKSMVKKLPTPISIQLRPSSVEAGPFKFEFDHTYPNGNLHVVEPLSFDLLEPDSVRDKSMRWIGYALHLKPYVGSLNLVVEGPKEGRVRQAYYSALDVLRNSANVYELSQADELSAKLAGIMG